ncbi:MAG: prepilin peptidase [Pseudomonadota bacterium]
MTSTFISLIFPSLLIAAAYKDITSFTIPNRIVTVMVATWPFAFLYTGLPMAEGGMTLLMAVVVLALGFGLFATNTLGAGDVKLLAAATLWVGSEHILWFLIYTTVMGGGLALFLLTFRKLPLPAFAFSQRWLVDLHARERVMPYGVAIAVGGILSWSQSGVFTP